MLFCDIAGEQGDFWEKRSYDLSSINAAGKDFEVVIEGQVGEGHRGDIAIDDITLSKDCVMSTTDLPGHVNNTLIPQGMR